MKFIVAVNKYSSKLCYESGKDLTSTKNCKI